MRCRRLGVRRVDRHHLQAAREQPPPWPHPPLHSGQAGSATPALLKLGGSGTEVLTFVRKKLSCVNHRRGGVSEAPGHARRQITHRACLRLAVIGRTRPPETSTQQHQKTNGTAHRINTAAKIHPHIAQAAAGWGSRNVVSAERHGAVHRLNLQRGNGGGAMGGGLECAGMPEGHHGRAPKPTTTFPPLTAVHWKPPV